MDRARVLGRSCSFSTSSFQSIKGDTTWLPITAEFAAPQVNKQWGRGGCAFDTANSRFIDHLFHARAIVPQANRRALAIDVAAWLITSGAIMPPMSSIFGHLPSDP